MTMEVRNQQCEQLLRDIGGILKRACPEGIGFALEIFTFGEGGDMFYVSNAGRGDMIECLRELIEKLES